MTLANLAEASAILTKYDPDGHVEADHDVLYLVGIVNPMFLTSEERDRLKELGWHEQPDPGTWRHYA